MKLNNKEFLPTLLIRDMKTRYIPSNFKNITCRYKLYCKVYLTFVICRFISYALGFNQKATRFIKNLI